MLMQDAINLSVTYMMADRCLISCCNLANLNEFALFCSFPKRSKYSGFFLDAHIPMVTAIVVTGYRFRSVVSVFSYESSYRYGMKSSFFCDIVYTLSFRAEFHRF